MTKNFVVAGCLGVLMSANVMASVAEPIAIKFTGAVERLACSVTVGNQENNTVALGNIAVKSNGKQVPVDMHFTGCTGKVLKSFKLTAAGAQNADGTTVDVKGGQLPTNLENVKVGLFKNDNNSVGSEIAVGQNILSDLMRAGEESHNFTWRPMYAQLLGERNTETGSVEAVGYFEIEYN